MLQEAAAEFGLELVKVEVDDGAPGFAFKSVECMLVVAVQGIAKSWTGGEEQFLVDRVRAHKCTWCCCRHPWKAWSSKCTWCTSLRAAGLHVLFGTSSRLI